MDSVISSGGPEKQDIPAGPEEAPQAAGGVINPVDAAQTASLLRQHVGGITLTYLLTLAENSRAISTTRMSSPAPTAIWCSAPWQRSDRRKCRRR